MLSFLGMGYQESKLRPNLKMASQRIQILTNKKSASVKHQKREIAKLLEDGKEEKARIKVEHVIRDDFTIESLEVLELLCELIHERIKYISSNEQCPADIREAISTVIWASSKIDVAELVEVKRQFSWKYDSAFMRAAENNEGGVVNERLVHKLSVNPPSAALVLAYLTEIAKEYNVAWEPTEIGLPSNIDSAVLPSPIGFSVPMAPGSELRSVYQRQEHSKSSSLPPSYSAATIAAAPSQVDSISKTAGSSPTAIASEPPPLLPPPLFLQTNAVPYNHGQFQDLPLPPSANVLNVPSPPTLARDPKDNDNDNNNSNAPPDDGFGVDDLAARFAALRR